MLCYLVHRHRLPRHVFQSCMRRTCSPNNTELDKNALNLTVSFWWRVFSGLHLRLGLKTEEFGSCLHWGVETKIRQVTVKQVEKKFRRPFRKKKIEARLHYMREKFKYASLFLQFGLPFTAFWKRSSSRRGLKTPTLHFSGDRRKPFSEHRFSKTMKSH